jgi:hypothetical protein
MVSRGGGDGSGSRAPLTDHLPPRSDTPSVNSTRTRKPNSTPSSSDAAAPSPNVAATGASATAAPSANVAATPTPTAKAQAQPTQHASDGGTPVVIVDDNDNVVVGGKRKRKSEAWLDFEEVVVGGKVKAECNWCKNLLVGSSRDGTNHLRNHIKSCPPRQARKGLKQATLKLGKSCPVRPAFRHRPTFPRRCGTKCHQCQCLTGPPPRHHQQPTTFQM